MNLGYLPSIFKRLAVAGLVACLSVAAHSTEAAQGQTSTHVVVVSPTPNSSDPQNHVLAEREKKPTQHEPGAEHKLRVSWALSMPVPGGDELARKQALALWGAIGSSVEERMRDWERMRALTEQATQSHTGLLNGGGWGIPLLFGFLIALVLISAYMFYRLRQDKRNEWDGWIPSQLGVQAVSFPKTQAAAVLSDSKEPDLTEKRPEMVRPVLKKSDGLDFDMALLQSAPINKPAHFDGVSVPSEWFHRPDGDGNPSGR